MFKKKIGWFVVPGVVCGAVAGLLRRQLMTHMDAKGLLPSGDPLSIALTVLTVAYLLVMLYLLRFSGVTAESEAHFPADRLRCAACLAAAAAMAFCGDLTGAGIATWVAAVLMAVSGAIRLRGGMAHPLLHSLLCVYFILQLIIRFRDWSSTPQVAQYAMQLLACVSVMLYTFRRTCWDARMGSRGHTLWTGAAAVYFCMASLSDGQWLYYAACALWVVGSGMAPVEKEPEISK